MFVVYDGTTRDIIAAMLGTYSLSDFPPLNVPPNVGVNIVDDAAVIANPQVYFMDTDIVPVPKMALSVSLDKPTIMTDGMDMVTATASLVNSHGDLAFFPWRRRGAGQIASAMCYGLYFVSETVGYALSEVTFSPVVAQPQIYKTVDGGDTWTSVYTSPGPEINCIYFPSTLVGYAVGSMGSMVKTVDGVTFVPQTTGVAPSNVLHSVFFIDDTHGWAVGDGGTIIYTSDGSTWAPQVSGTVETLKEIVMDVSGAGYAVGTGGVILKTINNGTNWVAQTSGTLNNINGVSMGNPITQTDTVYAAVETGEILKTTDGGTTWFLSAGVAGLLTPMGVSFGDMRRGWVYGIYGMYYTVDGGLTWIKQSAELCSGTTTLRRIHVMDNDRVFAIGGTNTVLGATVTKARHIEALVKIAGNPFSSPNDVPILTRNGTVPFSFTSTQQLPEGSVGVKCSEVLDVKSNTVSPISTVLAGTAPLSFYSVHEKAQTILVPSKSTVVYVKSPTYNTQNKVAFPSGHVMQSLTYGQYVYLLSEPTGTISEFDTLTNTLTANTYTYGADAIFCGAIDPTGTYLYVGKKVAVGGFVAVDKFDLANLVAGPSAGIVTTIASAGPLPYVYFGSDPRYFYIWDSIGTKISVINASTDAEMSLLSPGLTSPAKATLYQGNLYISQVGANTIAVLDTLANTMLPSYAMGGNFVCTGGIAGDGVFVFATVTDSVTMATGYYVILTGCNPGVITDTSTGFAFLSASGAVTDVFLKDGRLYFAFIDITTTPNTLSVFIVAENGFYIQVPVNPIAAGIGSIFGTAASINSTVYVAETATVPANSVIQVIPYASSLVGLYAPILTGGTGAVHVISPLAAAKDITFSPGAGNVVVDTATGLKYRFTVTGGVPGITLVP